MVFFKISTPEKSANGSIFFPLKNARYNVYESSSSRFLGNGYRARTVKTQLSIFMVGLRAEQVDDALEKIRAAAQHTSSKSDAGSQYGVVFVVRVDAFARL